MALRKLVTSPDPILNKKSRPVEVFDARLHQLLDDMAETMRKAEGVGLAAVQVGILKRCCVVDADDGRGIAELINPEILEQRGQQRGNEGCLSFPGEQGETIRPAVVKLKAQNRDGKWCFYKAEGLRAKAFCHEIDHMDGVTVPERWIKK